MWSLIDKLLERKLTTSLRQDDKQQVFDWPNFPLEEKILSDHTESADTCHIMNNITNKVFWKFLNNRMWEYKWEIFRSPFHKIELSMFDHDLAVQLLI